MITAMMADTIAVTSTYSMIACPRRRDLRLKLIQELFGKFVK